MKIVSIFLVSLDFCVREVQVFVSFGVDFFGKLFFSRVWVSFLEH